jgi:ABC-type nitrate/sulfonate/bicarbonate transport system substrate-binding protein
LLAIPTILRAAASRRDPRHRRFGVAELEYRVSWNTGLPTAVARGAGFFKEEGLDVRPVTLSSSGPIMMALLMSGHADLVIAGAVAILRGIAQNAPVVVVSGHLNRMSYALMTPRA